MKEESAIKIMKRMWENADLARQHYNYMLGVVFILMILDAVLILYKFSKGFTVETFDYVGGMAFLMLMAWTYKCNIDHRKKADEIHNLYLEMAMNQEKDDEGNKGDNEEKET